VSVTVQSRVASVKLSLDSFSIMTGKTIKLSFQVFDKSGFELDDLTQSHVTWTSSAPDVATVDSSGLLTAVSLGGSGITVDVDGHVGTAIATIVPIPVATIALVPPPGSIVPVGQSDLIGAVLRDSAGNILTYRTLTWDSSDPTVMRVVPSGVVTGLKPGSVQITGTSEGQSATIPLTVVGASPSRVVVSIAPATIPVGQTAHATVKTFDSNGHVIDGQSVQWSSQNTASAVVTSLGAVTGVAAGSSSIAATVGGVAGSATITVTPPTSASVAPVANVSVGVTPSAIAIGQTAQATATLRDSAGNPLTGRAVAWSSSNSVAASVSALGAVTAIAAGTTTITALSEGVSGSASLTVNVPPVITAPPPDPSSTGSHPNEPAGSTTLNQLTFDTLPPASYDASITPGWLADNRSGNLSVVADASSPGKTSNVGQIRFPGGFPSGAAPAQVWTYSPLDPQMWSKAPKTIYISFWLKVSSNWYGNASSANKVIYAFINNTPSAVIEMGGHENGPLQPEIVVQGVQSITGVPLSGGGAVLKPNVATADTISRGAWHFVEVVLGANSTGAADGTIQWWFDGHLSGSYANVVQWTTTQHQWEWMTWDPIYGGSGPAVPANQFMWMKNLYVSGQ
jgi:uncharacterized protein YjdB